MDMSISVMNSNWFKHFMMLSSNPLERFMRSDYVTLAFKNVVGHEAEVKEKVLEATEPVFHWRLLGHHLW